MKALLAFLAFMPLLGAAGPQPVTGETCVDVRVGSARSYDCVNRMLQALAISAHGAAIQAPSAAMEAANRTGQATESATRERLGDAFGHSVIPERPTAIYVNPLR